MKRHDQSEMDAKLATPAQEAVREVVRALPEETMSLAWRSSLNEELLKTATAAKKRDRLRAWVMRPVAGLALAGTLAMVVVLNTSQPSPRTSVASSQPAVEAALIAAHEEAASYGEVTGTGLTAVEVAYEKAEPVSDLEWSEVDVESL